MKRKLTLSLAAAAALILALTGAVLAAANESVLSEFFRNIGLGGWTDAPDEAVIAAIQYTDAHYEGNALRADIREAVYDPEGGTYTLCWTYEPLAEGDRLYALCKGPTFDGEYTFGYSGMNDNECYFTAPVQCAKVGALPENGSTVATLTVTVLRVKAQVVHGYFADPPEGASWEEEWRLYNEWVQSYEDQGQIVMSDDGVLETRQDRQEGESAAEYFVRRGLMELTDQFELTVDISDVALQGAKTVAKGTSIKFLEGDVQVNVTKCAISALHAAVTLEVTSDKPLPEEDFFLLGVEGEYPQHSSGPVDEPKQMDDGRWRVLYRIDATPAHVPDEVSISLAWFGEEGIELIDQATIPLIDAGK